MDASTRSVTGLAHRFELARAEVPEKRTVRDAFARTIGKLAGMRSNQGGGRATARSSCSGSWSPVLGLELLLVDFNEDVEVVPDEPVERRVLRSLRATDHSSRLSDASVT